jgi:predicted nuclease of predicted toxin-antitoxin system
VTVRILLDEHVSRVFEGVLRERGYTVVQASDQFGEATVDRELLEWCGQNDYVLLTNNAKDFESLHRDIPHAGLFLYRDQRLPDREPEALARVVDEVIAQYGPNDVVDEVVSLDRWYEWLHE